MPVLPEAEARSRFYLVDRDGLLVDSMTGLQPFQAPFAQKRAALSSWILASPDRIGLGDVVANARPTVLIGTSGQPHAFHEAVVRAMADRVRRPVIFPLSNPTERAEATPQDLMEWTEGRAVIGTGSPFPPVERDGHTFRIDQTNNAYVYPGIGLGAIAAKARRISDGMFLAAARTIAEMSPAKHDPQANLLPPLVRVARALVPRGDGRRQAGAGRRACGYRFGRSAHCRGQGQDVGAGLRRLRAAQA